MKNKKYVTVFVFALVVSISYFVVRSANPYGDTEKPTSLLINDNTDEESSHKEIKELSETAEIFNSKLDAEKEFKPTPSRGVGYMKFCGRNLDDSNSGIIKLIKKDSLSDKQAHARDLLIEKCQKWYDFYFSLSKLEQYEYHTKIQNAMELDVYFDKPDFHYDDEIKKTAYSIMSTGGDETLFTFGALRSLLKYDYRFLKRIADELNIESTNYITQNSSNLILLYQCSVRYEDTCSANSFTMMQMCSDGMAPCGLSFDQVIASWVTPNNYADLLQMVDIIRNLVRQGYFDNALDGLP